MSKIKTIQILATIISKLDIKPVIHALKNADIFTESKDAKSALDQLTGEKKAELALLIVAELTPQLGAIGADIPEFVALYYGVSREEADEKDFGEVVRDLLGDEGIRSFFATALRKKVERAH